MEDRPGTPPLQGALTPTRFMNQALINKIESEQFRKQPLNFSVGDTVRVHTKVVEGDRFRTFNWGKETKPQVSCSKKIVSAKHSTLNH